MRPHALWPSLVALAIVLGLPAHPVSAAGAEVSLPSPPSFESEVEAHFKAWDLDGDGALSANEVETAVADPANRGATAAAAVALRRKLRMDPEVGPITREKMQSTAPGAEGGKSVRAHLESLYREALRFLEKAPRELFTRETPKLDNLGQGHLGDCFLLVGLGMLVENDPERLKQVLEARPDGRMNVHLGHGRTLDLPLPTDGEIAIGARTRSTGSWGVAFEKAIGSVYLERQKTPRHVAPLSIVGVGGTPHSPVELVTGHVVRRTGCEGFRKAGLSETEREAMFAELRAKLVEAFAQHRLVVGGNGPIAKQAIVPNLYYNHSYGVIGYDAATDEVTFWNPFGNKVVPKGPPGLEHGYLTEHGRFRVPLREAVQWFGSFSIETDEPIGG